VPGPACYGRGGTEPTVTDAALVLGMLARTTLASGMELDLAAAQEVLAGLGDELSLGVQDVARGVMQIAGAGMAGAMRAVSIEVGQDPREASLIAYGGAGPLFGSLLARELGIGTVVVPNHAGNFSAWGLLEQDMVRSAALTIVSPLDAGGLARAQRTIELLFEQLDSRRQAALQGAVTHEAEFDLRYPGQEYTLTVPVALADGRIAESPQDIARRFAELYERTYGHSFDVGMDILSVRAIERTVLPRAARPRHATVNGGRRALRTARAYSFANEDWCEFALIERESLAPGEQFAGPAIVMEATTTSYIDAGLSGTVHNSGALVLTDALG
jgi:N-methylhydantoinase A